MGDVDWQVGRVIVAAMHGNLEELRLLVQQDRQVLDAQWGELTPLTVAAREGNLEVVRYLLDEGANINLQPRDDGTGILEEACMNGLLELVTLLLARGAYTGPDNMGWTPLMAASSQGHTDVAKLLLAHGCCDVDDRTYGRATTALHSACFHERAGVVGLLLEVGADPCLEDEDGITPPADVMKRGHVECVAVMQKWECHYLLSKARRLRDAAATLSQSQVCHIAAAAGIQPPAYAASRVEEGAALPEVEVEGWLESGRRRSRRGVAEGLLVREAVMRHVVGGMRGELVRELMGL